MLWDLKTEGELMFPYLVMVFSRAARVEWVSGSSMRPRRSNREAARLAAWQVRKELLAYLYARKAELAPPLSWLGEAQLVLLRSRFLCWSVDRIDLQDELRSMKLDLHPPCS